MKKILLLCLAFALVGGCQKKDNKDKEIPSNEEVFGEEYTDGSAMAINDYIVKDNLVELEVMYKKRPIDREHISFVVIDTDMVPFSFKKDGKFDYSQRFKMEGEELKNNKIYIKPPRIKKGQSYDFRIVFIDVPDYMPEVAENIHYEDQQLSDSYKTLTFNQDINNDELNIKKPQNLKWDSVEIGLGNFTQEGSLEYEDKGTLIGLCTGDINVMDVPIIEWKNNEILKWNIAVKKEYAENGAIYFFLDHKPLKLKGDFEYLNVDYQGDGFGVAEVELMLPDNIEKGYHTFYSLVFNGGNQALSTLRQRMVLVE